MANIHPHPNAKCARKIKTICHVVTYVRQISLNSATFLGNVHSELSYVQWLCLWLLIRPLEMTNTWGDTQRCLLLTLTIAKLSHSYGLSLWHHRASASLINKMSLPTTTRVCESISRELAINIPLVASRAQKVVTGTFPQATLVTADSGWIGAVQMTSSLWRLSLVRYLKVHSRSRFCGSAEETLFGGGFLVIRGEAEKAEGLQNVYPVKDLGKTQSGGDKGREFGAEKGKAVFCYLVKPFIHLSISSDEMRCSSLSSCRSSASVCPTGSCQWVSGINIIDLLLQPQLMSLWLAQREGQRWGFN